MLVPDGTVSADDGAFDVSEGSVDPLERGGQSDLATRSSDDRLMDAPGVADTRETVLPLASCWRISRQASMIECAMPLGLQAPGLTIARASRKRLPWGRLVSNIVISPLGSGECS